MQLPFYSEFRLPRYTHIHTCICVLLCVCVIAIHIPYIRLYRLVSLRREFVTDSRLFDVLLQALFSLPFSSGWYSILFSSPSLYHLILSRSLRYYYRGMHRKSPVHVYTLHAVVRIPAGPIHPWGTLLTHSRAWRDTHTRIWRSRSAGKLLLSRESLKTITSLQVREKRQERKTMSLIK